MLKTCNKCLRELPATSDYFYKDKKMKDGLWKKCIECNGKKFRRVAKEGYKICTKCGESLLASTENFYKSNKGRLGLQPKCIPCEKKYIEENKDQIAFRNKQYYQKNKDDINAYKKSWYEENKDTKIKEYKEKNKEYIKCKKKEYLMKNKDSIRKYRQKYRQLNPELSTKDKQVRKAKQKQLDSDFTVKQWKRCKKHFDNKCAYCGEEGNMTQDHFIPLSKGGEYTINNIIPVCRSCNSSKHNKDFFEWYCDQNFYSKQREKKVLDYLRYESNKKQQLALSL
jgi:5-methylcytosine-specific restriction endonuclease McrA